MKKKLLILVVVILVASMTVVPVLAKSSLVKGVVTTIGADTITLETKRGEEVIVNLPDGFDLTLAVGDTVIAKYQMVNGVLVADWVKKIGKASTENEDKAEGSMDNSAYCDADKKQEPHPFATVLADKYGVKSSWVMENFCGGYSMGAIMLALKTQAINDSAEADELLSMRAEGLGWGAIWKDLNMIGNERDAKTPPGLLKKP